MKVAPAQRVVPPPMPRTSKLLASVLVVAALAFAAPDASADNAKRSREKSGQKSGKSRRPSKPQPAATADPSPAAEADDRARAATASTTETARPVAPAPKPRVYTFGGLDVNGNLKAPQLLFFRGRVKQELDTSSPEKRSFLKELEKTADAKGL
ncbi:MAG TPA: hypothetical protein VGG33_20645 [Polyangia bacterium]